MSRGIIKFVPLWYPQRFDFVGCVFFRSNVLGTKFTVYDGGENPEKKPFVKECESLRQELAAVCYVSPK